jgi:hypothetical protein
MNICPRLDDHEIQIFPELPRRLIDQVKCFKGNHAPNKVGILAIQFFGNGQYPVVQVGTNQSFPHNGELDLYMVSQLKALRIQQA